MKFNQLPAAAGSMRWTVYRDLLIDSIQTDVRIVYSRARGPETGYAVLLWAAHRMPEILREGIRDEV